MVHAAAALALLGSLSEMQNLRPHLLNQNFHFRYIHRWIMPVKVIEVWETLSVGDPDTSEPRIQPSDQVSQSSPGGSKETSLRRWQWHWDLQKGTDFVSQWFTTMGSESTRERVRTELALALVEWPWESQFSSLSLSGPTYKMRMILLAFLSHGYHEDEQRWKICKFLVKHRAR